MTNAKTLSLPTPAGICSDCWGDTNVDTGIEACDCVTSAKRILAVLAFSDCPLSAKAICSRLSIDATSENQQAVRDVLVASDHVIEIGTPRTRFYADVSVVRKSKTLGG